MLPDALNGAPAALLIVASFFTSAITASLGVGGGIAMLALLGVFVPVAALIPVHGAIQLGSNTGRAWHMREFVRADVVRPLLAGSLLGAAAGAFVVVQLPDAVLKLVLGLFVVAITWTRLPAMQRLGSTGLAAGGAVLALITMIVGATGPLLSALLAHVIDERRQLVATMATGMTIQHLLKIVVFGLAGFAFAAWLPFIAAMIASGYLGTIYGAKLLARLPEQTFRRWFRIALTLLALGLVWQGVAGLALMPSGTQPQTSSAISPAPPTISRHQPNGA